jgi:phage terminase large subunit-like protein
VVVIQEPRQVGKTAGVIDLLCGRASVYRDYRCAYTAQTGHMVSERFTEWIDELEGHPALAARVKARRSGGTERITMRATRSYLKAFPPKDGALRGPALDVVVIDEAQEHDDILGAALDKTAIPTMNTRRRRQLFVVGTAGTDQSAYFARYLQLARDGTPGYALFDYGAPEGVDTDDEALWPTWHPGLMAGITDLAALRMARGALGEAGFAREYATMWTRTASARVIPEDAWRSIQHTTDMPPGVMCLAIDVAFDRSHAAIVLAGPARHLEVVDVLPVEQAIDAVLALQRAQGLRIAIDNRGPNVTVFEALERAGAQLLPLTSYDVTVAAAGFLDAVKAGDLSVWPSPALDEAVAVAGTKPLGDGFTWSRRASAGSIAPLVAATTALWGVGHLPPQLRPEVHAS